MDNSSNTPQPSHDFVAPPQGIEALESFRLQAKALLARHGAPANTQAGLFTNIDPKKFLSNLHIILSAVDPFIPAPVGPILTAIDEVLGKIDAATAGPK